MITSVMIFTVQFFFSARRSAIKNRNMLNNFHARSFEQFHTQRICLLLNPVCYLQHDFFRCQPKNSTDATAESLFLHK